MSADGGRTPDPVRSRFRRFKVLVALALFTGLLLNLYARNIARGLGPGDKGVAVAVQIGGFLLMLGSGIFYARLKGRSGWWGLIGLLGCIGFFVLLFLDKQC